MDDKSIFTSINKTLRSDKEHFIKSNSEKDNQIAQLTEMVFDLRASLEDIRKSCGSGVGTSTQALNRTNPDEEKCATCKE
ncbi:hypothetical protein [Clostridium tunisiense]|uniref:hypothetical protein n=1 Tax=Clostridium tunisiense TaxID=219748 RepID=UPI0003043BED|nr:hypothetical protein [Clostridium tunisiense]